MTWFITKKWIKVHHESGNAEVRYKPTKQIRFKTSMLQSDLCDYSDEYIVVKGTITMAHPDDGNYKKNLAFKDNTQFISCILKINDTLLDNVEDLDLVMPMYDLIEYSKNYLKTTGSLWNYYGDKPNSGVADKNNNVKDSIKVSKSFDYRLNITEKLKGIDRTKNFKIAVLLKHLGNFWRTWNMPWINWEGSLILNWSENCVLKSKATKDADPNANPPIAAVDNPKYATFKIIDTKLYVPVVNLSTQN